MTKLAHNRKIIPYVPPDVLQCEAHGINQGAHLPKTCNLNLTNSSNPIDSKHTGQEEKLNDTIRKFSDISGNNQDVVQNKWPGRINRSMSWGKKEKGTGGGGVSSMIRG